MHLSIPQYAQALLELEKEGSVAETASRFSAWLSRRGEGRKLRKIVAEAERIVREESGVALVTITTRKETDDVTKESLRTKAGEIFTGKKVEAVFAMDTSVIGGMKMQSETLLYDATLSTAVRKLRTVLSR